ncbi:MAG: glycosyltransferase [Geminicoccaceae bacterium]|nr:glycosyltransferase [Geminicoccaceae bacterium]
MSTPRMLSVVVPVLADRADLAATHRAYEKALKDLGRPLQVIYVVDGDQPASVEGLRALKRGGAPIEVLAHAHPFGEATALTTGFRHARGGLVMTLPAEPGVDLDGLARLVDAASRYDVVVGVRRGGPDEPARNRKMERVASRLFGKDYKDLRSNVRVLRKEVADELTLYGNQQAFLPLLAETLGFTTGEVDIEVRRQARRRAQAPKPSVLLDLVTAYFLIRFMKKPFRFFGGFGLGVLALGVLVTGWLVLARLFFDVPLLDRPALILSTLMVVLGIQIIAVGLIGEIVTFAYTKEQRDYRVDRIVE